LQRIDAAEEVANVKICRNSAFTIFKLRILAGRSAFTSFLFGGQRPEIATRAKLA
jgi:hypothetical protein